MPQIRAKIARLGREQGLKAHFYEGSMRGIGAFRFARSGARCFPHTKAIYNPIKIPYVRVAGASQADICGTERKGNWMNST